MTPSGVDKDSGDPCFHACILRGGYRGDQAWQLKSLKEGLCGDKPEAKKAALAYVTACHSPIHFLWIPNTLCFAL